MSQQNYFNTFGYYSDLTWSPEGASASDADRLNFLETELYYHTSLLRSYELSVQNIRGKAAGNASALRVQTELGVMLTAIESLNEKIKLAKAMKRKTECK